MALLLRGGHHRLGGTTHGGFRQQTRNLGRWARRAEEVALHLRAAIDDELFQLL